MAPRHRVLDTMTRHGAALARCCFVLLIALAMAGPPARAQEVPPTAQIRLSRDLQRISVRADQVPRGRVLSQLSARLGVEIRAYDVDLTAPVTVSVEEMPLEAVVARVLPADARYVIRYGEREVLAATPIKSGSKRGSPETRPRGVPTKGRTRPYVRNASSVVKTPARSTVSVDPRQAGPGVKQSAAQALTMPAGSGPKRARPSIQTDSSLRLTVTISSAGAVRIVGATRVAGERAATDAVRGTLLYVVRASGGNIAHYGTLLDPLEVHSYLPGDRTHDQRRATEGTVQVPLPVRLSDRAQLATLSLELYDAREASLPSRLDAEALTRVLRTARPYQRVALEQAIQYLNR